MNFTSRMLNYLLCSKTRPGQTIILINYSLQDRPFIKVIFKLIKHLGTLTFKTNIHYQIFNIKKLFQLN